MNTQNTQTTQHTHEKHMTTTPTIEDDLMLQPDESPADVVNKDLKIYFCAGTRVDRSLDVRLLVDQ